MQSITGKEGSQVCSGQGIQDKTSYLSSSVSDDKNLPAAHCPRCDRAGFRPVIIPPEPEDPRDIAVRTLIAIKDHDRNLNPMDHIKIDDVIRICRRSLHKDNAGVNRE